MNPSHPQVRWGKMERIIRPKCLKAIFIFLAVFTAVGEKLFAAIITMNDTQILVVKIVAEDRDSISFMLNESAIADNGEKNVVTVKKNKISKVVYEASDLVQPKAGSGEVGGKWKREHQFSLSGMGIGSIGPLKDFIPYGYGLFASYNLCFFLCQIISERIKLEWVAQVGYMNFRKSPYGLDSFNALGGMSLRLENFIKNFAFGIISTAGVTREIAYNEFGSGYGNSFAMQHGIFMSLIKFRFHPFLGIFHYYSYSPISALQGINLQMGGSIRF